MNKLLFLLIAAIFSASSFSAAADTAPTDATPATATETAPAATAVPKKNMKVMEPHMAAAYVKMGKCKQKSKDSNLRGARATNFVKACMDKKEDVPPAKEGAATPAPAAGK